MTYRIEYQLMQRDGSANDCDLGTGEEFEFPVWIPLAGDSVDLDGGSYIVLTRHFLNSPNYFNVNLVVRELTGEERQARVAE